MIPLSPQSGDPLPGSAGGPPRARPWIIVAIWIAGTAAIWEILGRLLEIRADILPSPSRIALETLKQWPLVLENARVSAVETLTALVWIAAVSLPMVALSLLLRPLAHTTASGSILLKIIPVAAAAPLFLIWFGFGSHSKIFLAALMGLLPLFLRSVRGFSSLSPELLGLMKLMGARRTILFTKVLLPSCVPNLLTGFRDGTALALLGVLVGEFVGAEAGLGHLMVVSYSQSNTPLMFAVLVLVSVCIFLVHLLFEVLENLIAREQRPLSPQ